jgi:hypothetical protein
VTKAQDLNIPTAIAAIWALSSLEAQIEAARKLVPPGNHQDVVALLHHKKNEKRKLMSRADCQHEGCWGPTSQDSKEKSGALRSLLDGKKRLIVVDSFYEHLITRYILSHPANKPAPKGTATRTRFVRKVGEAGKSSEAGAP